MTGRGIDPRDLRVSDAERTHVLRLLGKATGHGLIDATEFDRRSEIVLASKTRAELNATLIDLPGLSIAGRSVEQAAASTVAQSRFRPGFSGAPGAASAGVLELNGWGSRSFQGHWSVPPRIVIGGIGAATKLDFSEAVVDSTAVTVEFQFNFGGAAELILPRGASVRSDGLRMRGGTININIEPGGVGVLDVLLTGVKTGGAVSIHHPRNGFLGR